MRKDEIERMRNLLVEAVTALCRSGLKYSVGMRVEGLLGITLDEDDVVLVNINKSFTASGQVASVRTEDGSIEDQYVSEHETAAKEASPSSPVDECFTPDGEVIRIKRERGLEGKASPRKKRRRSHSQEKDITTPGPVIQSVHSDSLPYATQVGSADIALPASSLEMTCSQDVSSDQSNQSSVRRHSHKPEGSLPTSNSELLNANVSTSGVHSTDENISSTGSVVNPDNFPEDIHIQNAVKIEINSTDDESEDTGDRSFGALGQGDANSSVYAVPVPESMLLFGQKSNYPVAGPSSSHEAARHKEIPHKTAVSVQEKASSCRKKLSISTDGNSWRSMREQRCHDSLMEKVCDVTYEGLCHNTNKTTVADKKTAWGVKIFRDWLTAHGRNPQFEQMTTGELSDELKNFYFTVRTKEGNKYSKSAMTHIRSALNKHLTSPPHNLPINLQYDPLFFPANLAFDLSCRSSQAAEKDQNPLSVPITPKDIKKLYSSGVLSVHNPVALQRKVFFEVGLHFRKHGRNGLRQLKKSNFRVSKTGEGVEYAEFLTKRGEENRPVSLKQVAMLPMPGDPKCPVQSLKLYLSKLNPDCEEFFQQPNSKFEETKVWYNGKPIGRNKLGRMMRTIAIEAQLSLPYTSHCIRATPVSALLLTGAHFETAGIIDTEDKKDTNGKGTSHTSQSLEDKGPVSDGSLCPASSAAKPTCTSARCSDVKLASCAKVSQHSERCANPTEARKDGSETEAHDNPSSDALYTFCVNQDLQMNTEAILEMLKASHTQ